MIRDIVRDTFFLAQPSSLAERRDVAIVKGQDTPKQSSIMVSNTCAITEISPL